jgi:inosose dehydratase
LLACPLGEGDVELSGFIKGLADIGYDGWIVVEQDRAAVERDSWGRVNRDQALNRSWLADRLSATGGWTGLP